MKDVSIKNIKGRISQFMTKHEKAIEVLVKVLKFCIPIAVSVGLLVWMFEKINIEEMKAAFKEGCNFWWIALMMLLTMLSHIIRGIRWGIQLRAVGVPRMPVTAESVSIFGAYALNLIFPWLGEGWRCVYVSRREKTPLTTIIGTDFGDRISDAVMILLLLCFTLIVARGPIDTFLSHYAVGRDVTRFADNPWMWCCIAFVIALLVFVFTFFKKYKWVNHTDQGIKKIWDGFKVLFTMKGRGVYVLLTLGIWTCYFLENFVCFFAFPFTRQLTETPGLYGGLLPGLVVFVFGSFSMGVPSNGGLGPWNLAVMFALSLYGISDAQGAAYSLVVWGFQTIMLVANGIFAAIYISLSKKKGKTVRKTF